MEPVIQPSLKHFYPPHPPAKKKSSLVRICNQSPLLPGPGNRHSAFCLYSSKGIS